MVIERRVLIFAFIVSAVASWLNPARASAGNSARHITVSPSVQWVRTGVFLVEGGHVSIQANGSVLTSPGGTASGPNGQSYNCDSKCTFSEGKFGQLIGKVTDAGHPFAIGAYADFVSQASGELFLGVNDCCDWSDNQGAFTVLISSGGRGAALDTVPGSDEERDRQLAAHSLQQVPQAQNQVTLAVILDQEWTDTGVYLRQGQSVKVTAYGTMNWYTGACNGNCRSTPAGIPCPGGGPMRGGLPCLSLLGRIGKAGRSFEVGESAVFTANSPGEFFLGVNDDNLPDNTGAWTAKISSPANFSEVKARQQTTLPVALDRPWIDTGVYLAQGQSVTVTARGTMNWYTGSCNGKCLSTPAGIPCPGGGPKRLGLTCLSLIGLIGVSGRPFYVGDSLTFTTPAAGELFLGVNDDNVADNTGDWTATISSPIAFVQWAQAGRVRQQLQQQAQHNKSGISPAEGLIILGLGALVVSAIAGDSFGESSDSCDAQCQERSRLDRYSAARIRCNNGDHSACSAINEPPPPDPEPPQ